MQFSAQKQLSLEHCKVGNKMISPGYNKLRIFTPYQNVKHFLIHNGSSLQNLGFFEESPW